MESTVEKEPSEVITPDTENATYFIPSDVDESNTNYRRLQLLNRGTWKDRREENKEVKHRQDNLALFDALAGQVELTDYQKTRGRHLIDSLELGEMGIATEAVVFGVCVVVANADVPHGTRYWPSAHDSDQLFRELADDLGYSIGEQQSVISKVKSKVS